MPQRKTKDGPKNLIAGRLRALRAREGLSQRAFAREMQLRGLDIDKNVVTRIETEKRYVTDIELRAIALYFRVSYEALLGEEKEQEP